MEELVELLLETANLKRIPRAGWLTRGVPDVESVAGHSFGVAIVALAMVDALEDEPLDLEKVLIMALLHDLGEARLTDLPSSAARLIPPKVKAEAEAGAIGALLAPLTGSDRLRALWQEFEDQASPEGRLVRDADKLEMMVQCLRYEQAGSRGLEEFWEAMDRRLWHYELSRNLYTQIRALSPSVGARPC
jgi:putative hydrolase of HD superfamily